MPVARQLIQKKPNHLEGARSLLDWNVACESPPLMALMMSTTGRLLRILMFMLLLSWLLLLKGNGIMNGEGKNLGEWSSFLLNQEEPVNGKRDLWKWSMLCLWVPNRCWKDLAVLTPLVNNDELSISDRHMQIANKFRIFSRCSIVWLALETAIDANNETYMSRHLLFRSSTRLPEWTYHSHSSSKAMISRLTKVEILIFSPCGAQRKPPFDY